MALSNPTTRISPFAQPWPPREALEQRVEALESQVRELRQAILSLTNNTESGRYEALEIARRPWGHG